MAARSRIDSTSRDAGPASPARLVERDDDGAVATLGAATSATMARATAPLAREGFLLVLVMVNGSPRRRGCSGWPRGRDNSCGRQSPRSDRHTPARSTTRDGTARD